ncbi:hypothetical protein ARMSODRAFT_364994 [Armillaria solidipes]|uniref:Uncharacterized protein n=1 Tax=Armillaria solidipes TaxID=1076256 RepID=A0A2H3BHA3_9AGAR|nr:hypothetical protein ARMSODRAFT_364994 [Armillaria solidipes]
MLFLVEMTCFVPRVAQCLHFVSCHRLECYYRPTVCPADRGLCCLQLPYTSVLWFSYVSLPSPFLVFYPFCLCVLSLFRFSCPVLLLQVCCIVMFRTATGSCPFLHYYTKGTNACNSTNSLFVSPSWCWSSVDVESVVKGRPVGQ